MEYKTGKKIFQAISTAQLEGFTLDQFQRLIENSWEHIRACNNLFEDLILEKITKENNYHV